jgi:hypothetical protein
MFSSQSKRLHATAQATADGAPVPAGLAGAAHKRKSNRAEVAVQHVRLYGHHTAITAEKVTAAAKSSATSFKAPRISRCGEDASVLRRDAEPPAERAAETRVLAKPLPGARCNVATAFRVRETCIHASTGKVLAVSTFQDSEFPRRKKKERTKERYRFKNTGGAGDTVPESWGGAFWEYLNSFQEPAQVIQIPDSAPRLAPDFGELDRFQDPNLAMQNPD